ncbi:ATP-binding protein [Pedobacter helvus]|uniref:ATP-binding protein n=1 Tax=Pedobacter helvus TaxID=2563444 RepID=A0ABW9JGQ8_9SPHI|nr:ATP-binding protein [Pedobacter ureilyticus]
MEELVMRFDPNTIEHLGVKMYATLPPVIAEIVSNSYDAEATEVEIWLFDNKIEKEIVIKDNGHGMTFEEINTQFLRIGRNRRKDTESQFSKNSKRHVIGKKGIGKLSFFGISSKIRVETVCEGLKNAFVLDWTMLKQIDSIDENYKPEILVKNEAVQEQDGTKITLQKINRATSFYPEDIAYSLAKSFQVFDENDFKATIYHNNLENQTKIKNELIYKNLKSIHEWNFPVHKDRDPKKYYCEDLISGKIILTEDTVSPKMRGVALFSRNKLVNEYEFYDIQATSHGYSYLTGWLNVDFIDLFEEDVISTNRRSLNWETTETRELKAYLASTIQGIYNESKKLKEQNKLVKFEEDSGIKLDDWIDPLPNHDRKLAQKLVNSIISSEGIGSEKAGELVGFVKDSFQFESFKEIVKEFNAIDDISSDRILSLFKEWELIEAREMYKLSMGRIETIKTFEKLILDNAKEVQQIHPFFEKFPWILDPRINMFRHEVQYAKILKETYGELDIEEKNRRIDFLCTSVSNHRFILEIKRPQHIIKLKDIEQAKDYRSFIEDHLESNNSTPNKVIAYVVGGKIDNDDRKTRDEIESMQNVDKVYVKTFNQLLTDARNYHKEFIERYEQINKKS